MTTIFLEVVQELMRESITERINSSLTEDKSWTVVRRDLVLAGKKRDFLSDLLVQVEDITDAKTTETDPPSIDTDATLKIIMGLIEASLDKICIAGGAASRSKGDSGKLLDCLKLALPNIKALLVSLGIDKTIYDEEPGRTLCFHMALYHARKILRSAQGTHDLTAAGFKDAKPFSNAQEFLVRNAISECSGALNTLDGFPQSASLSLQRKPIFTPTRLKARDALYQITKLQAQHTALCQEYPLVTRWLTLDTDILNKCMTDAHTMISSEHGETLAGGPPVPRASKVHISVKLKQLFPAGDTAGRDSQQRPAAGNIAGMDTQPPNRVASTITHTQQLLTNAPTAVLEASQTDNPALKPSNPPLSPQSERRLTAKPPALQTSPLSVIHVHPSPDTKDDGASATPPLQQQEKLGLPVDTTLLQQLTDAAQLEIHDDDEQELEEDDKDSAEDLTLQQPAKTSDLSTSRHSMEASPDAAPVPRLLSAVDNTESQKLQAPLGDRSRSPEPTASQLRDVSADAPQQPVTASGPVVESPAPLSTNMILTKLSVPTAGTHVNTSKLTKPMAVAASITQTDSPAAPIKLTKSQKRQKKGAAADESLLAAP